MLNRLHQRFAQCRQQARGGKPAGDPWARFAVHSRPELAFARKGKPGELDFEVFIPAIILDGNSQVRFHKLMKCWQLEKSTVHDIVHARCLINTVGCGAFSATSMIATRSSTPEDADAISVCVDAVSRERRYLGNTSGFSAEQTRSFIASLSDSGGIQIVVVATPGL